MAVVHAPAHRDVERRGPRSSAIVATSPSAGRGALAVLTWVLAVVGAWSLCLAVGASLLAAVGIGGFGLPAAAAVVGAVASVAIVVAELLASHPAHHHR